MATTSSTDAAAGQPAVVVITGATGPVGRATARRLAAQGARLALVSRDQARLDTMAAELAAALAETPGADAPEAVRTWTKIIGDLRQPDAARDVARTVEARYGRIDALVHLVGGWVGGTSVVDLDPAEVQGMLDQHLWTTLHMVQAIVPGMIERGYGRVVAVSSPVASTHVAGQASYAIGKSSEEVLVGSLARELAGTGVTANLVTIRGLTEIDDDPGTGPISAEAPASAASGGAPTRHKRGMVSPDAIARVLAYLVSPDASSVNGERIALGGD
jgi:NAD(P)-dependent dehydrogenase (short-subunit alcohol dehydrogenase family)